jgi:hypothetical protein
MIDIKNVLLFSSGSVIGFTAGYFASKPRCVKSNELDDKVNKLIAAKMGLIEPN